MPQVASNPPKKVFEASYARVWDAIRALVKRAIKSGDIAYHRAVMASAKANGVGFACNVQALVELGTGGS